ncbi:mechanosensitive ion channel family protein [Candidatus Woesearchaeota archaeon]|nr:mechanosensitive ion channel family protein [Candidatus Woesearchaeota archaeon]
MKNIGTLFLFLLTAATGAAAYFAKSQNIQGYYAPITKLLTILLVIIAANIITRIGVWLLQRYGKAKEKAELKQITSIYKYAVLIVLVLVILVLLYGVIGPAITSIGLLAAGLTLALQRPILNLAGWFSIAAKRPFRIGDRVDIGNVGGYVHDIALMHTHISLVEKDEQTGKMAYIPNETALTQPIVNYTKGSALVWSEIRVRAPLKADVKKLEKRILECAEEAVGRTMKEASRKWNTEVKPEVRTKMEYSAANEAYIELALRFLCNVKELPATKSEVTKRIIAKFRNGMER